MAKFIKVTRFNGRSFVNGRIINCTDRTGFTETLVNSDKVLLIVPTSYQTDIREGLNSIIVFEHGNAIFVKEKQTKILEQINE